MIKNCLLLLLVLAGVFNIASAQDRIVEGVTPNLYLSHKVESKETWYSIGREYGLSPKEIAAYNKTTIDKPLEIGQSLKVPLTAVNFSQNDPGSKADGFIPVYHIVGEREWMYRVSVNHNKVPVEKLEKWNGISRDQVKAGTKLIVGYLRAKGNNNNEVAKPAEETTKTAPVVTKQEPQPVAKQEPPVIVKQEQPAVTPKKAATPKVGGYFKDMYEETGKSSAGVAGIFKSTSGWNDGKYYALMNNVVVGTIVKIVFPQTNKVIYAKVLGELPDMKESTGLALRISDAAASELGAANNKFSVDIKY